jgi:cell division protein FtsQ
MSRNGGILNRGRDRPAPPRDRNTYDRRKKRGPARKTSRPLWRSPLLWGLAVVLLAGGGGGGWWAWKQGLMVEVQQRFDTATRGFIGAITPFKLADITVEGREYVEPNSILAALGAKTGESLLGIDLQAARQRLEAIDWVASATVERRLPDSLYVILRERKPMAIWQDGNRYILIDENGRGVQASTMPPGAEKLLLLGGAGAPEKIVDLAILLAEERSLELKLRAAVWVGQRRWNLVLQSGVEIWLPEDDTLAALHKLAKLEVSHGLLKKDYGVIDMRLPDKLYLRKRLPENPGPV